jgi:hypothetical protein
VLVTDPTLTPFRRIYSRTAAQPPWITWQLAASCPAGARGCRAGRGNAARRASLPSAAMETITLPAGHLAYGYPRPDVCVRHGETAVFRRQIRPVTPPPAWLWLFAIVPALFILLWLATRKQVSVAVWPFCPRCRTRRRVIMAISVVPPVLPFLIGFGGSILAADQVRAEQFVSLAAVGALLGLVVGGVVTTFGSPTVPAWTGP